jgi:hypothetical protein
LGSLCRWQVCPGAGNTKENELEELFMPVIQLEVSPKTALMWEQFLDTMKAGRLKENGLLGDWTLLAFMAEVDRYLRDGLPGQAELEREMRDKEAATARKRLTKMQKRVLPMYNENESQTTGEISRVLGLTPEDGAAQVAQWLDEGFLAPGIMRDGQQTYILSPDWQKMNATANRPSLNTPRTPHLPEFYKG